MIKIFGSNLKRELTFKAVQFTGKNDFLFVVVYV